MCGQKRNGIFASSIYFESVENKQRSQKKIFKKSIFKGWIIAITSSSVAGVSSAVVFHFVLEARF